MHKQEKELSKFLIPPKHDHHPQTIRMHHLEMLGPKTRALGDGKKASKKELD
jgi:hypothetical protein